MVYILNYLPEILSIWYTAYPETYPIYSFLTKVKWMGYTSGGVKSKILRWPEILYVTINLVPLICNA